MHFSQQQEDPRRHAIGFSFVVVLHVAVVYALVTGLAQKVVEVVRAPIETKVIEEIKRPPPPQDVVLPPPQMEAPPPPFIPPPEVQVQQVPPPQSAITVQQTTPPPTADFKPMPPADTATLPQAAAVSAGLVCPNYARVMGDVAFPREAMRQGIEKGEALIEFTVTPSGAVTDTRVVSASHAIFARSSLRIVGDYQCKGQSHDVLVRVPFGYKLD